MTNLEKFLHIFPKIWWLIRATIFVVFNIGIMVLYLWMIKLIFTKLFTEYRIVTFVALGITIVLVIVEDFWENG